MIFTELEICVITFDFENSCKSCFGWKTRALSPKTQVYVNSGGVAEIFDPRKVNNKTVALRRAMSHVNLIIEYNAYLVNRDIAEVHDQIVRNVGAYLDEDNPFPLTIGLIERINHAIYKLF